MSDNQGHKIKPQALANILASEKKNDGAAFTIRSKSTGKDFTYTISRNKFSEKWYTHVSVETSYLEFNRLGSFIDGKIINKKQEVITETAKAIGWVLRQVQQNKFDKLEEGVDVLHFGSCIVCGRPLTDADSIELGVGPVCRKKSSKNK